MASLESTSLAAERTRYTGGANALYWSIAALMIRGFPLGRVMIGVRDFTSTKLRYF